MQARIPTVMILAAIAGLAAGCAGERPRGFELGYQDQGRADPALTYGEPGTDYLYLLLECRKGSGRVRVVDTMTDGGRAIVLSSGAARAEVPATVEPDEESGEQLATGQTDLTATALLEFRRTGMLRVSHGASSFLIRARASEMAQVGRFFEACGSR
jgi:hypothetical protein